MSLVDRLDELDSGAHQGKLDVDELIRALQNERFSPQILPYKGDIVDRLKEQIDDARNAIVEKMNDMDPCARLLHELQIDRIRFLLASYLRARLLKIEKYAEYITNNDDMLEHLSEREQVFAKQYSELEQSHLQTMFLNGLPDQLKSADQNTTPEPDTNTFVFCKVRENIGRFQLSEDDIVNLNAGDTYVLEYEPIIPFIERGQIDLI